MDFQITNAGIAATAAAGPAGPFVNVTTFKVGLYTVAGIPTQYTPSVADTALHGTVQYTGTISAYSIESLNIVDWLAQMNAAIGNFDFNEIGLYLSNGTLFALYSMSGAQSKTNTTTGNANVISITARMNYAGLAPTVQFNIDSTSITKAVELASVDFLYPPVDARSTTNLYLCDYDDYGRRIIAMKKASYEWSLFGYSSYISGAIDGTGTTTPTTFYSASISNLLTNFASNRYVIQFLTGTCAGQVRKITAQGVNFATVATSFANAPLAGDTFVIYISDIFRIVSSGIPSPGAGDVGNYLKALGVGLVGWAPGGGGGGGSSNPSTTLALGHYSISGGVITEDYDLFTNITATRVSAGEFDIALLALTFPNALSYSVECTVDAASSSYSVKINGRTTTGFHISVTNSAGTSVDPTGLNLLISGTPSLSAMNMQIAPVGIISYFAANTPPVGYLECNGAAVSRTIYAALFAIIGTTYGSGNGVTTFNLPDIRGGFLRGWDHGRGIDVGRVFGSSQNSLCTLNIPLDGNWPTTDTPYGAQGYLASPYNGADGHPVNYRVSGNRILSSSNLNNYPNNVAMLPCIKAQPDFLSYASTQQYESYTVTNPAGQTIFNTANINVNYCYLFVDGAYQPPSQYTINSDTQITFGVTINLNSVVDFVKIYAATPIVATQAQMEAAVDNTAIVTAYAMKWHPGVAKAFAYFTTAGPSVTVHQSWNTSSITRASTGQFTMNLTNVLSAPGCVVANGIRNSGGPIASDALVMSTGMPTAGAVNIMSTDVTPAYRDPAYCSVVVFGDLP